MSRVLDGRAVAEAIRDEVAAGVSALTSRGLAAPCLAAVLVGEDPASVVYVRSKMRACKEAGIATRELRLPATSTQAEVVSLVRGLSEEPEVDGILVQMPLPAGIDSRAVIDALDPAKDIDGFHPINVGRLWSATSAALRREPAPAREAATAHEPAAVRSFAPCTPSGVIELLDREGIPIEGSEAVVVGRSDIVGRPMAALLLRRHATVTLCHSRTRDLARVASRADILVAAIGRPAFVTRDFIRAGATVIDVGINRIESEPVARALFGDDPERMRAVKSRGYTLVGDVHPGDAREKAGAYTPVPGGVGPLTVAMLLRNTLEAARGRRARGA